MTDRSVLKALAVLDTLGDSPEGESLSELSKNLQIPVSTMHRLLATLASQGYVEREPDTGRYVLGHAVLRLQSRSVNRINLTRTAFPYLRSLVNLVEETANLGTLSGAQLVYLESVPANRDIGLYTPPGTLAPAHCTSMGKVLLAHMTPEQIDAWLGEFPLTAATPKTITNPDEFKQHLISVRRQGFAMDEGEWVSGVRCFAAPVRNHRDEVIAAVSVSAPSGNYVDGKEILVREAIVKICNDLSVALGRRDYRSEAAT